jgi:hypothetical protein
MKQSTLDAVAHRLTVDTQAATLGTLNVNAREAALLTLGLLEVERKYGRRLAPVIKQTLDALADRLEWIV